MGKPYEVKSSQEIIVEPVERATDDVRYPILDRDEVWDGKFDLRGELAPSEQAQLRPPSEEVVIHIYKPELALPQEPVLPIEVMKRATKARSHLDIGYLGPAVASVNLVESDAPSRYQREHGRDGLIAGKDVFAWFPKLLDSVVVSLAKSQGISNEPFDPSQPYGFEKPGSIILVNFNPDDPLGQKFRDKKGWKPRFYGSADAPGLFVDAIADLEAMQPGYLLSRHYTAVDGNRYSLAHAFKLSTHWLVDRMSENSEGLIEYQNPYRDGRGMRNQGWKDSADAIVHQDGNWANSNAGIATLEIQVQAVTCGLKAARIYREVFADESMAAELENRSRELLNFILENGWVQDSRGGYFAMGWDRDDHANLRRIETRSIDMHSALHVLDLNNPNHKEMAFEVVKTLLSEEMFTRWGSRLVSSRHPAYRALGYHYCVWPDKSNRVAESMSAVGLHRIDRFMGSRTTAAINELGFIPEHFSGSDGPLPELPDKDVYVFNKRYNEVHLFEQVPPPGQTWGASSDLAKQHRYASTPLEAAPKADRDFEKAQIKKVVSRYGLIEN